MSSAIPPRPTVGAAAGAAVQTKRSPLGRALSFLSGWLLAPMLVLLALFACGVHCGANQPQAAPERWVLALSDWWNDWTPPIEAPPPEREVETHAGETDAGEISAPESETSESATD